MKRSIYILFLTLLCEPVFAQIKPVAKQVDSVGKKTLEALKQKAGLTDSTKTAKQLLSKKTAKTFSKTYLDQFSQKKALLDSGKKNKNIRFNNLAVNNSTLVNNALNLKQAQALNSISVFGQIEVFKFPLAIDLSNNSGNLSGIDPIRDALFKVNLDKTQYQQVYKNELNKFSRFKTTELSGLDVSAYLKKTVTEKLKPAALVDPSRYQRLNALLNSKEQVNALLNLNEDQIREKVNELLAVQEQTGSEKLDSAAHDIKDLEAKARGEITKTRQEADKAKGQIEQGKQQIAGKKLFAEQQIEKEKSEVASAIISLKHKMEDSGLDQQRLLLLQNFIANKGSLKDLDAVFQNELSQQETAPGIGKFYSKIKAFQAGNFAHRMPGSFMNKDLFINGVNFIVKTSRGPVNMGFGVNKDVGMPKDAAFSKSMFDSPKLLTYVSVPTSNFSFGSGKLSWIGTFDKQQNGGINQLNSLPKNGLAVVVSQNFDFNKAGKFTVELSKSATQYKNISVNESDKLVLNQDLRMGNYFRDDFMETMSIGLKHNLELKKFGLSGNTFFSYSGLGFQNPGQQGYGNMGTRMGANLKKNFLKNKVVLNVRSDIKNTPLSSTTNAHWRNYNLQLDSRFKLSKHYTLNLKYIENGVNKVEGPGQAVYSSQKMQADMNVNYKIGGNYGLSHLSVGKQLMANPSMVKIANQLPITSNTNFMTVIYSQNLMMKSFSLSANAFYNKELSGVKILGDMLNADMGCQYTLFKDLSVSSSVTYLDNQNIARQVGVRQNIQLTALKKFDISAFFDVRKNLINPLYPDLFSTGRGELSITYYLNK